MHTAPVVRSSPSTWFHSRLAGGLLSAALIAATGCAGNTPNTPPPAAGDMAMCVGFTCNGGCDSQADCKAGTLCDPASHKCVGCIGDNDCPPGGVCSMATHTCAPGCSNSHACGDAGLCEQDAGMCVACLADGDCKDPMKPRCDPGAHQCVPCLPDSDNCGWATWCEAKPGSFTCSAGCKGDDDCRPLGSDGGGSDDGGSDDGGDTGDGGGGADGGGGGGSGNTRCDVKLHQCVRCIEDNDCPAGKVCKGDQCVDGCTNNHACPQPQTCCNNACTDLSTDYQNCGACDNACMGGWNCCNSMCSNPVNDVINCGMCGNACKVANGSPACALRACGISKCSPGWADCNGAANDGCEMHTDVNVNNCGACNNACALPHASPRCGGGMCQIDACLLPWADCDMDPKNGCELNVQASDVNNCGGCGLVCNLPHATPLCDKGTCGISACDAGYSDCNLQAKDGCEINSAADTSNCGACGKACSTQNGKASCAMGACSIACNMGFADCDNNVGNGCEINLGNDTNNCNGCGKVCQLAHATANCANFGCVVAKCDAGFADCNGVAADGCEINLTNDANNCNGCGAACSNVNGTPSCANGACQIQCTPGFANCDNNAANGCEINLGTDARNCNACGKACDGTNGTPSCAAGACQIKCNAGWDNCDGNVSNGCETNLLTSAANCGACGSVCALPNAGSLCMGGGCVVNGCSAGWGDCDGKPQNGCEVNLTNSVGSCGACGNGCGVANGVPACQNSSCVVSSCNAGFADCNGKVGDGCEINVLTDAFHCGGCGQACSGNNIGNPTCGAGQCNGQCSAGFADCDGNKRANGCEINLTGDNSNCGGCGVSCAATCQANVASTACSNSACVVQQNGCKPGFYDVDSVCGNGCECAATIDGAACNGATNLGVLPAPGTSVQRTSNLVPIGREVWYVVTFANGAPANNVFHPRITLTGNPNNAFSLDVRSDCNTGIACGNEGGTSIGRTDWETSYTAGDPGSPGFQPIALPGNNGTVFVRVYRTQGALTCDSFVLTISE